MVIYSDGFKKQSNDLDEGEAKENLRVKLTDAMTFRSGVTLNLFQGLVYRCLSASGGQHDVIAGLALYLTSYLTSQFSYQPIHLRHATSKGKYAWFIKGFVPRCSRFYVR